MLNWLDSIEWPILRFSCIVGWWEKTMTIQWFSELMFEDVRELDRLQRVIDDVVVDLKDRERSKTPMTNKEQSSLGSDEYKSTSRDDYKGL